mmetsp:Transcript_43150/g.93702  ORF Transcript_43150/g.93702 Transcript_43150/m.93702 type:complete len:165 (-) Transcript_43150:374-868(-)
MCCPIQVTALSVYRRRISTAGCVQAFRYHQRQFYRPAQACAWPSKRKWSHESCSEMVTVTLQRVHFGHDGPDLCRYDDLSSKDKVSKVQGQVNEVTGIMERNVQQMTENIQAQEVLLDKVGNDLLFLRLSSKTESMRSEASTFSKRSSALKRKAFWRNIKVRSR